MLTVRLTPEIESEIDRLASVEKKTKSDIVKEALREYIHVCANAGSAFELGEGLFGIAESGETDRSIAYRNSLKEQLHTSTLQDEDFLRIHDIHASRTQRKPLLRKIPEYRKSYR